MPRQDDAVVDPDSMEVPGGLRDEVASVRQEQHALALLQRAADEFCCNDRLAGASWRYKQDAALGILDRGPNVGNHRPLVAAGFGGAHRSAPHWLRTVSSDSRSALFTAAHR